MRKLTKILGTAFITMMSVCIINLVDVSAALNEKTINGKTTVTVTSLNGIDEKGDATLFEINDDDTSTAVKTVLVDVGGNDGTMLSNIKSTSAYIAEKNKIKLNYLVLTHGHGDHVGGLKVLMEALNNDELKGITINNLYLNVLYPGANASTIEGDNTTYKDLVLSFITHDKVEITNIVGFTAGDYSKIKASDKENVEDFIKKIKNKVTKLSKDDVEISYATEAGGKTREIFDTKLCVIVAPKTHIKCKTCCDNTTQRCNNSSLKVSLIDNLIDNKKSNFNIILGGDMQRVGITDLLNSDYLKYFKKKTDSTTYTRVYYKTSHHGKRSYNKENSEAFFETEKSLIEIMKPNYVIASSGAFYDNIRIPLKDKINEGKIDKGKIDTSYNVWTDWDVFYSKLEEIRGVFNISEDVFLDQYRAGINAFYYRTMMNLLPFNYYIWEKF